MMTNKKHITVLTIAVVALGSLLVGYIFFFITMKEKNAHALDAVAQADLLEGKERTMSKNALALKQYRGDLEKLDSFVVKEENAILFAKSIEGLGTASGTNVSLETLNPTSPSKGVWVLAFSIKATGNFEALSRLLGMIENYPARIDITNVMVMQGDGPGKEGVPLWSITISGNVLSFIKA